MPGVRLTFTLVQPLTVPVSSVRYNLAIVEPLVSGVPTLRHNLMLAEPLIGGFSTVRACLIGVQALFLVEKERPVSENPFPGFGNSPINPSIPAAADPFNTALPGLTIEVKKAPRFRTAISEAASGQETRYSQAEYPRWDFELSYDFLEDRSGADSSLKTILGFFLARNGSAQSWLFKDPDDYLAVNGFCGIADGVTPEFPLCRTIGEFSERVGQVDPDNTISIYEQLEEVTNIPVSPGPYTVTVANAAGFIEDLGVEGFTKVTSVSGAGEYSVDEDTGIYTFFFLNQGDEVTITYRYQVDPADYEIVLPNSLVFNSSPPDGAIITADFQFFFACRFLEDQLDFEKFADKLWNLQQVQFRSIIQ